MIQILADVKLLLECCQRTFEIQPHGGIRLLAHRVFHLKAAHVCGRNWAPRNLTKPAIRHAPPWAPVRRWPPSRVHQRWKDRQAGTVDTLVALSLDLHLRTTEDVRERLHFIHALLVIIKARHHKWVVVIPVEKLILGKPLSFWMEHRAVNPLAAILFVNKPLVSIDNHHKVVVIRNRDAVDGLRFLAVQIHRVLATKVGDCVFHPLCIPAFVFHFLLEFLRCKKRAPENVGTTLRVGNIRGEDHLAVRGAGIDNRTVNRSAWHW